MLEPKHPERCVVSEQAGGGTDAACGRALFWYGTRRLSTHDWLRPPPSALDAPLLGARAARLSS